MPTLTFLGAARTVTGSKYLLDFGDYRLLVDCGLFQGLKELRDLNWQPLTVEAATVNAVVLTHAHLDHSGYLPRLVAQGFSGRVFCTLGTADLCRLILPDSARLQEEDARLALTGPPARRILFGGDLGRYNRPVLPNRWAGPASPEGSIAARKGYSPVCRIPGRRHAGPSSRERSA
jgi:metallo-beta-lactamase family protein